jgi:hypothetical protein
MTVVQGHLVTKMIVKHHIQMSALIQHQKVDMMINALEHEEAINALMVQTQLMYVLEKNGAYMTLVLEEGKMLTNVNPMALPRAMIIALLENQTTTNVVRLAMKMNAQKDRQV